MSAARAGWKHRRHAGTHGSPVPIQDAMKSLVRELGIAPKIAQYDILTAWPDVVGPQIARVTKAERVENGILYVSVATAPWRAELSLKRRELVEKLNTRVGTRVLSDIRFR